MDTYTNVISLVKSSNYENNFGVSKNQHYVIKTISRVLLRSQINTLRLLREITILKSVAPCQFIVNLVDIIPPGEPQNFRQMFVCIFLFA